MNRGIVVVGRGLEDTWILSETAKCEARVLSFLAAEGYS